MAMPADTKSKLEVIDFIKGYSILSIVLYHYFQGIHISSLLTQATNFGSTGIHTFLFVSGFGLFLSQLKNPLPYPDFLKKRFTKIYIPYIITVTLSALISLMIPMYENSWNDYFSHIFLYKMFDGHLIGTYGYQFWFISTIVQFYLLFPLIIYLREKCPGKSFLIVGLLISYAWAILVLLLHNEDARHWNSFFLMYLWEFVLGMYCAEMYLRNGYRFWNIRRSYLLVIDILGLLIYSFLAMYGGRFGKTLNDVPALFGYAALCILIYKLNLYWVNRFILFTSKISYTIFLIHFLVLNLVYSVLNGLGISWSLIWILPTLLLCYLIAMPMDKFFSFTIGLLLPPPKKV
jgi:peptidoglycan/LPS O-acetylase OafA/YrhL